MSQRVVFLSSLLAAVFGLLDAAPSAAQAPTLCEAVDDCGRVWTTGGDVAWFGQTAVTSDDVDAAQSGDIHEEDVSYLETTVEGPVEIAFLWKVSSESNYDFLDFSIDGEFKSKISGEVDWTYQKYPIGEGEHTLTWQYYKDESVDRGLDAGFVDRFTVLTGGTGSVQTVITPEAAVTDGAQWALDDGDWQDSGVTLSDVAEGPHTVSFKPVDTWETPVSRTILVRNGETSGATGAYYQICDLVDACQLSWSMSGDAGWTAVATGALAHDGVDAAQTTTIDDGQSCGLETTFEGPGAVAFWWRVSSEQDSDYLRFYVDDILITSISGEIPWTYETSEIGAGTHTLKWAYEKDDSGMSVLDAGFLDEVTLADGTPGDLTVNLLPADAVDAGAQWSVDDGATWNDSGVTLSGIASGVYTITFSEIGAPWFPPLPKTLLVPAGGAAAVSETYVFVCEGVGACNRDWTLDGDSRWFTQTAVSHDGHNACQSGDIGDNEYTSMSTTVTGPATVSFWWKVSSEDDYDFLTFYMDGASEFGISGDVDWTQVTHAIPEGPHTLTWQYDKDASASTGADAGWVDQLVVWESDPPTGSVVVNNGAARTGDLDTELGLTWDDGEGSGVTGMRFSNNGSTWSAWQKPAATKAWALAPGDGVKTVRAQFRDKAGNVSAVYTDAILLDQTPPSGSITINGGAWITPSLDVTLSLSWDDGAGSGVSRMRFSNNGSTWSAWEPAAAAKAWTLPGWGVRTVRVQYLDRAGNASERFSDYINAVAP